MSAKWRRNKKRSKWFNIFRAVNSVRVNGPPKTARIGDVPLEKRAPVRGHKPRKTYRGKKWREPKPLIDILEENDELMIVAELTGFERENLKITAKGQRLTLSADAPNRRYYKSLNLPARVIPDTMYTKYKNGVLEIRLKKSIERRTIDNVAG